MSQVTVYVSTLDWMERGKNDVNAIEARQQTEEAKRQTDKARMRRALYQLMWTQAWLSPCPMLSDKEVSHELYSILASAGVRRLSERAASFVVFVVVLLFIIVAMPAMALLVRLCVWLAGL